MKNNFVLSILLSIIIILLPSCRKYADTKLIRKSNTLSYAISWSGSLNKELRKALSHYNSSKDTLKYRAMACLIRGLPYQAYSEIADTTTLSIILDKANDSRNNPAQLTSFKKDLDQLVEHSVILTRRDVDIIDADFLINNVELAFEAWQKPWARSLSFDEFCRYILPYKSPGQKPHRLRAFFLQQYSALCDSLPIGASRRVVCAAICQRLQKQYEFVPSFGRRTVPILSTEAMLRCRVGRCSDLTRLGGEVMRALELPVAHELGAWGNYGGTHTWNVLYEDHKFLPFAFTDAPPGTVFKCEATVADQHYRRKRSKVWRYSYLPTVPGEGIVSVDSLLEDVSASTLSCTNVVLPLVDSIASQNIVLCTFAGGRWVPVSKGILANTHVSFKEMGKAICYLPASVDSKQRITPIAPPFLLTQSGRRINLKGENKNKLQVKVTAKYPINNSNKIKIGDTYQLLGWQRNSWHSFGQQKATANILYFNDIPDNVLLWLRDIDRGREERIFTYENNRQVWW